MKVILTQEVDNIGLLGEVVTVKDGFARNYLIPKGIAVLVTPQNMKIVEEKKKKEAVQTKKRKEDALALAARLTNFSCTIPVKVIEDERLFGSVTAETIQKAFEAEGITVEKKTIQLDEPIKKLGVYQIPVKLHAEVSVECKVWVVKE
ncbi:MAG: 50S ribosomal protein L9 [Candidatus Omnitrophota bacterium]